MAPGLPARVPVKIAVRLPNWLGDTVMAVPAIRALRDTFPDAKLLLAGPWVALLAGQGLGDVLVAYPRRWSNRLRPADTVRSFGSDIAVLLPNSFEAAVTALYWRARRRIGFGGDGRRWLLTDAPPRPEPRLHQIDEYLRLVEIAGGAVSSREPRLTPPEPYGDARQRVRDLAKEYRFDQFAVAAITTAASELSRNVWVHAQKGVARISVVSNGRRVGLELEFVDHGPGIADLNRALAGGFSTAKSLGLGLSGTKRLVDDFNIETAPGQGTRILIRKWTKDY